MVCLYRLSASLLKGIPGGLFSFDQARLIRQNQIFAANGIGPSGESAQSAAAYARLVPRATDAVFSFLQDCLWTPRLSPACKRSCTHLYHYL